jgi:RHS repeat-associated protein
LSQEQRTQQNLDDFEARYYSSQFGRFQSADWSAIPAPIPYADLGNPQTLNLYAYVKNNPINLTDPTGHQPEGQLIGTGGDYMAARMISAGGNAAGCAASNDCSNQGVFTAFELTVNGEGTGIYFGSEASGRSYLATLLNANTPNTSQTPLGAERLSEKGLDFIARHETIGGVPNLTVYEDTNGHETIGYGHLVQAGEDFSKGITAAQAKELLANDVKSAVGFVNKHNGFAFRQWRFDAIVSVAFNSERAALLLLRAMGHHQDITTQTFLDTLPPQSRRQQGLINRRTDEANLFLRRTYGGPQ